MTGIEWAHAPAWLQGVALVVTAAATWSAAQYKARAVRRDHQVAREQMYHVAFDRLQASLQKRIDELQASLEDSERKRRADAVELHQLVRDNVVLRAAQDTAALAHADLLRTVATLRDQMPRYQAEAAIMESMVQQLRGRISERKGEGHAAPAD